MSGSTVTIASFVAKDRDDVAVLILRIQDEELGGADGEADTADLRTIAETYQHGAGNFWVARDDDRVVGTVALKDIGHDTVFLKRMYVDAGHRGPTGIAARLLNTAVAWARDHGARAIYLGTTMEPPAAPRFYRKHGFEPVDRGGLPPGAIVAAIDDCFFRRLLG